MVATSITANPQVNDGKLARFTWLKSFSLFGVTLAIVFLSQTWPYWLEGKLLAGTHVDGAYHYYVQLDRLFPNRFQGDIAVKANQDLGYLENTYDLVRFVHLKSGLSLLDSNTLVHWISNLLYLAGVITFLSKWLMPASMSALGTLLSAQPFVIAGSISTGVMHGVAIPNSIWLWPLPWFLLWFVFRQREKLEVLTFYSALGIIWGQTYPLWAILFGMSFFLVDLALLVKERKYASVLWLAAGWLICVILVVGSSMEILNVRGSSLKQGDSGIILSENLRKHSIVFEKAFRRIILFSIVGILAFRLILRGEAKEARQLQKSKFLFYVAVALCVLCEPLRLMAPVTSALYMSRAGLLVYLLSMLAVALYLQNRYRGLTLRGKCAVAVAIVIICTYPIYDLQKLRTRQTLPIQSEFVRFCSRVRTSTPEQAVFVAPPIDGMDYFRVYAERSLWITRQDTLYRASALVALKEQRLRKIELLYGATSSTSERASALGDLLQEGVGYMVTHSNHVSAATIPWPVILEVGPWQLRSASEKLGEL